jgi:hypothetical protein
MEMKGGGENKRGWERENMRRGERMRERGEDEREREERREERRVGQEGDEWECEGGYGK